MLFALVLLSNLVLAATGPLLEILNYSTTPATVYAGTIGYLQISLKNSGDSTASSATAYYNVEGVGTSLAIGDISAGSNAQVTVPFKIQPESAGGIQVVSVDVSYLYQAGQSTGSISSVSSKRVSMQVPIIVSQPNPLEVRTLGIDKASISAVESVTFNLSLVNTGGVANNVVITTPDNSTFVLDGTSQKTVGTIAPDGSRNLSLTLLSSSTTPTGTYTLPIVFTFYDRLARPTQLTLGVGPVSVLDSSTQYRLEEVNESPMEVGSQSVLRIRLTNTGTRAISATVDVNATDVFTPIGLARLYFDSLQPNGSITKDVLLGVSSSATPGYYTLPLKLTPSVGSPIAQYAGIAVQATPKISLSIDNSGAEPQLTVANSGNSPIHSVEVLIVPKNSPQASPVQSFIGTLNVDDYSSVALSGDLASGTITAEVRFKDSTNTEQTATRAIDVSSGASVLGTNVAGGFGGGNRTGGSNRSPGLFGIGGARAAGSAAGSPVPFIVGAVVVIVVAYFVWRWWSKKKEKEKKQAASGEKKA
ncbi:MAG: hypothetical protein V1728_02065 [Candidatus Micrarchaeota archaeon]